MQGGYQQEPASLPALRVFLFGDVTLERRVAGTGPEARYERIPSGAWQGRGPALTLLKVLLCRPRRRATKEDVVALIWSGTQVRNAGRACDAAASVLRSVLRPEDGESLLLTGHSGKRPWYRLADQRDLWVDADACDACVDQAIQAEGRGNMQEALQLWEEAFRLQQRGPFLEDDASTAWARERRQLVEGNQRLCLHHLADRYLADQRREEAEVLLRNALNVFPTDEDLLFRLLSLLAQQDRTQETLHLITRAEHLLSQEEGRALSARIRAIEEQLRRKGTSGK
ncbi:MAG TPA: bacterial transcriptional activator domain-containing protein [Ktedonobacteraceae bacterium]|nr:bacterial transcriptional activator domain-containing protein [Ktedonobacteraceae bacterium]